MQSVRDDPRPFSRITVVLGRYICQILPVVPKGARKHIVAASLRRLSLWKHVRVLSLVENMCLDYANPDNTLFVNYLMEIGSNPQKTIQLPSTIHNCTSVQDLILSVYSNLNIYCDRNQCFLTKMTILYVKNNDVSSINDDALNMFSGEPIVYLAANKIVENEFVDHTYNDRYPSECLNCLFLPGLLPFKLKLKVGCSIILL
ncbi:hypothetical protein GIB67_016914 [Kingdonia uniflora]|uniref:ATP-dependent DNA helicase n=1 Tax=Kingdonia uniflora TaxID=39325 RepID=A0A7J7M3G0_9MAGN|nr:hypothetical protein GIB67_016914 [Kingdonia uniflora]